MGARPSHMVYTQDGPLRLYSLAELLLMEPPAWLVHGMIPEGSVVGVYAPPESLKSFFALGLAMSVATGRAFHGHDCEKGYVVYISAEGGSGMNKRALAWLTHHDVEPREPDIAFIIESMAINADSQDMERLLDRLMNELQRVPKLVVIDTLARCFDGNENEQEDMGRFIAGVDMLRRAFGCAVLVVHHTRLDGERERGNTAFRGAADTMISLRRDEDAMDVKCTKQKDAEHFDDFALEKRVIEGTDSCVLVPGVIVSRAEKVQELLDVLRRIQPCKWDTWVAESGMVHNQFMKYYPTINRAKLAIKLNGLWQINTATETPVETHS